MNPLSNGTFTHRKYHLNWLDFIKKLFYEWEIDIQNNDVDWNDETKLSVLVGKDFTCLDNTIEDQSDNYPNPRLKNN